MMIAWDVNDHVDMARHVTMVLHKDDGSIEYSCVICGSSKANGSVVEHYDTCPISKLTRRLEMAIDNKINKALRNRP